MTDIEKWTNVDPEQLENALRELADAVNPDDLSTLSAQIESVEASQCVQMGDVSESKLTVRYRATDESEHLPFAVVHDFEQEE